MAGVKVSGKEIASPLRMLLSVFPLGALAAVVVWFVYVGKYGQHGEQVASYAEGQSNSQNAEIAFQAVVASVLLYFVLHHHVSYMYM